MPQAMGEFTEKIYERFLEKLRGDEEIPPSLIAEIERLKGNNELASSATISRGYENWEGSHAED